MGTFGESRRQHGRRGRGRCRDGGNSGWDAAGGPLRPVFGREDGFGDKPDYHTAALCKQVRRVVGMTLSGECGDEVLQSLIVDEVLAAPNAGRLLVRVMVRADLAVGADGVVIEVLRRLEGVQRLLRMRVGEAIARKRTPELAFEVVPVGPRLARDPATPDEGGAL